MDTAQALSPLEHHPGVPLPVLLPPLTATQRQALARKALMEAAEAALAQARATAYSGHLRRGTRRWEDLATIAQWLRERATEI